MSEAGVAAFLTVFVIDSALLPGESVDLINPRHTRSNRNAREHPQPFSVIKRPKMGVLGRIDIPTVEVRQGIESRGGMSGFV